MKVIHFDISILHQGGSAGASVFIYTLFAPCTTLHLNSKLHRIAPIFAPFFALKHDNY